jgi:hypothetical protein
MTTKFAICNSLKESNWTLGHVNWSHVYQYLTCECTHIHICVCSHMHTNLHIHKRERKIWGEFVYLSHNRHALMEELVSYKELQEGAWCWSAIFWTKPSSSSSWTVIYHTLCKSLVVLRNCNCDSPNNPLNCAFTHEADQSWSLDSPQSRLVVKWLLLLLLLILSSRTPNF